MMFFSKSGSSSSGQSIRTNFTGYTTNFDSMYNNHNDQAQPNTATKRNSVSSQPRLANGQFSRMYPQKREPQENKTVPPSSSVPYHSHDHQYQKPVPPNYNGLTPQHSMHGQYQQGFSFSQQTYPNSNQMMTQQQQAYQSPNPSAYHSPQHTGMQSPHEINAPVPQGFQSPTYSNQMGYHSPGHAIMSPQHGYTGRGQEFHYAGQSERQHIFANQSQQQPAVFQSPPHQPQYANQQYYQRSSQVPPPNQNYNQQSYHGMHNQYNNNANNMYASPNQHSNTQNFNAVQSSYRQSPKQSIENNSPAYVIPNNQVSNNQSYQIYQSPQSNQNNYRIASIHNSVTKVADQIRQETSHSPTIKVQQESVDAENNATSNISVQNKNVASRKSPSSALRNIRHDHPNVNKHNQNSPDFSNQFLNFISNRNEPKDNANTPKFTNSPSISQKMHKNLYVSSPEQAQIPPSSGMSDSDSKDGMTAQTATPIQSAKVSHTIDKQKDMSKRQLDFEHRVDIQSEDSRDSVSKDSRISSVYSRQSDFQSDGYGMDIDSENSMECAAFKSTHSISLVETSDIPRPADIDFPSQIDPFNKKIVASLLEYVKFPNKTHAEGYIEVRSVPKLQLATVISVGNNKFSIDKQLGKGNYGAVFLCLDLHSHKSVAVKYQKPSRPWEFYICQEIKARIKDPFMVSIILNQKYIFYCFIGT